MSAPEFLNAWIRDEVDYAVAQSVVPSRGLELQRMFPVQPEHYIVVQALLEVTASR